eukprot:PLAT6592.1.p1 GENE.PLAT6592.1~~PLAT6592.1.p1  ORF type:complete len:535 (-),score=165.49 PLAT6592.1:147-1688(-)
MADALLACPLCSLKYSPDTPARVPRCLACGHTFCTACCVSELSECTPDGGEVVICPTCSRETSLPTGAVEDDIGINQLVLSVVASGISLSAVGGPAEEEQRELCGSCPPEDVQTATLWCSACETPLCKACSSDLHSRRAFSSHEVVPISERDVVVAVPAFPADGGRGRRGERGARRIDRGLRGGGGHGRGRREPGHCREHPGEFLILYCRKCDRMICSYCEKYGDHRGHSIISLKKKAKRKREQLERLARSVSKLRDFHRMSEAFKQALADMEEEWDSCARRLAPEVEHAGELADKLITLAELPDDELIHAEELPGADRGASLCDSAASTLAPLRKSAMHAILPGRVRDFLKDLRRCRIGGAEVMWDPSATSSGYGYLYSVSDDGQTIAKVTQPGTITTARAKEAVEPGTSWTIRIVEPCHTAQAQIGFILKTPVQTVMNTCWMSSSPSQAWCFDATSLPADTEVVINYNGPGLESTFEVDGSVRHRVTVPAGSEELVYPAVAIRHPCKLTLV